jgi:peptidase E
MIKCIRESGFKKVLEEFLERGGVYCGSSAGSYVACPSMEMATWKKPAKFDRHGITDFAGMNLVPFLIVAHCTPEIIAMVKPQIEKSKYDVKLLNDQQAIQIKDGRIEFLEDLNIQFKNFGG